MKNFESRIVGKIVLIGLILCSFSLFSAATYNVGVEFQGEIRAKVGEAEENGGKSFVAEGKKLDTLNVKFSGSIDNVDAFVQFSGGDLGFDKARVTVNDLFDGLLTVAFFTVENEKGKNDLILPDKNFYGGTVHIKPIDILSIHVSYGIGDIEFLNVFSGGYITNSTSTGTQSLANDAQTAFLVGSGTGRDSKNAKSELHSVALGVDLNMDFIGLGVYSSIWIFDNAPRWIKTGTTAEQFADAVAADNKLKDITQESPIALVNVGLSVDALKFFGSGLLKLEFGTAVTGAYTYDIF